MSKFVINLKFYGGLYRYINNYSKERGLYLELNTRKKIIDILIKLGVPRNKIVLIMAGNKPVSIDYFVKGNDVIKVFPPIGGG